MGCCLSKKKSNSNDDGSTASLHNWVPGVQNSEFHYFDAKTDSNSDTIPQALNPVRMSLTEAEKGKLQSTLGPKWMDKILVGMGRNDATIQVTNDGATILRSIGVDNPTAKILVDICKARDEDVGDGTTVTVLAAEFLCEGVKLIPMKRPPQTIIAGWRKAAKIALDILDQSANNNGDVSEKFRKELLNITPTTRISEILSQHKEHFSKWAVNTILRVKGSGNLDAIIKKQVAVTTDSFLDERFLLDKKIAEKPKMKDKADKILKHDMNLLINRQFVYNYPEQLFADAKFMAKEKAYFDGIKCLVLVTGGEIVSNLDPPEGIKIGRCDLIHEITIVEDKLIKFSGVAFGEACTIAIRGATSQIVDEAERSLHDALCLLADTRAVYGEGCSEALMANGVLGAAVATARKESVAKEPFAKAILTLPMTIADNAGYDYTMTVYDSADLVAQLKANHNNGMKDNGLNMNDGTFGSMEKSGITEYLAVNRPVVFAAVEAAEKIMRVDNIIRAAPRQQGPDTRPC